MRIMKNARKYILLSLICFFSLLGILTSVKAEAATPKGSITYQFAKIANVDFKLYRVGEQDKKGGFRLVSPFDSYDVNLESNDAASTLAAYIARDKIDALWTQKTDEEGKIVFDDLEEGVYLIIGEDFSTVVDDSMTDFFINPVMVSIPQKDNDNNLIWDMEVTGKYLSDKIPEGEDKSKYFVQKIWAEDAETDRPEEIIVQLLEDGQVKEEVALNKDNNWSYKWTNLEIDAKYKVVEKEVPEGYTVSQATSGINKTIITNTKKSSTEEGTTEEEDTTSKKKSDKKSDKKSEKKIPQTGQLWWPVGLMLCCGLIFLIVGVKTRRRDEEE